MAADHLVAYLRTSVTTFFNGVRAPGGIKVLLVGTGDTDTTCATLVLGRFFTALAGHRYGLIAPVIAHPRRDYPLLTRLRTILGAVGIDDPALFLFTDDVHWATDKTVRMVAITATSDVAAVRPLSCSVVTLVLADARFRCDGATLALLLLSIYRDTTYGAYCAFIDRLAIEFIFACVGGPRRPFPATRNDNNTTNNNNGIGRERATATDRRLRLPGRV